ncbi:hypothetical protein [Agrococcus sp. TF02-05]|uniref:hypothetical protein n=1 Tax=Agrococcus sp. TF02-05 TaxID=2815211 RepID=UPI001AA17AD2|nr:hypothetical protein [Agrococcus sp. TF02-05]MBO1769285.1 hypothetical protein [Agrococcus sp. TF02-05]
MHAPLWARFRLRAFLPFQAAGSGLSFDASLDAVRPLPLTAFFERLPRELGEGVALLVREDVDAEVRGGEQRRVRGGARA